MRALTPIFGLLLAFISASALAAEPPAVQARIVQFREPGAPRYVLAPALAQPAGLSARSISQPAPEWTLAALEGNENVTFELGRRIALEIDPSLNLESILKEHSLVVSRIVRPGLLILEASGSAAAIAASEALAQRPGVLSVHPIMRRPVAHRGLLSPVPNDTFFARQWQAENRDATGNPSGPDLNLRAAWAAGQGRGQVVAIADDGIQLDHPDLRNQLAEGLHFDFFQGMAAGGPFGPEAVHSTPVAGLVAAEADNDLGVAGVAPLARLASWTIWGLSPITGFEAFMTDEQAMDMFQYASNRVSIQNHSWGSATIGLTPFVPLVDAAISNAVTFGRDGKGVIIIRAGGNARDSLGDSNDEAYTNDPRVIGVAAIRRDGRACSYSSTGASLLVSAPSGDSIDTNDDGITDSEDPASPHIFTTDRTGDDGLAAGTDESADYTGFNGTSASAPQIAGVAALILEANPELTYRDVQQIFLLSARQYDVDDPFLHANGAGFWVSRNSGFGVPDAALAVSLARTWRNRPPFEEIQAANETDRAIADDSLRLLCSGEGLPSNLASIRSHPALGRHPDDPTPALPLVYVGQANEDLTVDLRGKGALIERGITFFYEKIGRAARAGAAFAVIFNNTGTTNIQPMGATDFVSIPAVSIGRDNGLALRDWIAAHPETTGQLRLTPAVTRLVVTNTLICEHVGVRLQTTHRSRADVRVTLVSPMGTRSILQAINADDAIGPADWTYWSTQHFYESSAGEWRVEVSDQRNTVLRGSNLPATGFVISVRLIVRGVPIQDTDRDGLDDAWEERHFGNLDAGPAQDPNGDGLTNARAQILGSDPLLPPPPWAVELTEFSPGQLRLVWASIPNTEYLVESAVDVGGPWRTVARARAAGFEQERVLPRNEAATFFRVMRSAAP